LGKGKKKIQKALEAFNKKRDNLPQPSRNVNWDGGAVTMLTNNGTAELEGDIFLNGAGFRQIAFQPKVGKLSATEENFDSDMGISPFSGTVTTAPLETNEVVISFFLEDKVSSGMVHGFGAIFTDVEQNRRSGLVFYGQAGEELATLWAPKGKNGDHSFVGGLFDDAVVASVKILFGDNGHPELNEDNEGEELDFVAVDDIFFFLSDTEVAPTTFRGFVSNLDEEIIKNFDNRRAAAFPSTPRNINWDAPPIENLIGNDGSKPLPFDFFLNGGGFRQITVFKNGAEEGFVSDNGFDTDGMKALSPFVNFAPKGGKTLTAEFFLEVVSGEEKKGLINGYAAIFNDVELPNKSGIRCYDRNDELLVNVRARPGDNGDSQFVGVMFPRPVIAKCVLDLGDNDLLGVEPEDVAGGRDFVAVDDWFFLLAQEPK